MFKIKYFDHTADIGFLIKASTLNELFKSAALATFDVMTNLKIVKPKKSKKISLKNKNIDLLLFNFIEELIFLKDANYFLFSKFKIKINKNKDAYILNCKAFGEKINTKKHELKVDVKAITLHQFYVKKIKNLWNAKIILDI